MQSYVGFADYSLPFVSAWDVVVLGTKLITSLGLLKIYSYEDWFDTSSRRLVDPFIVFIAVELLSQLCCCVLWVGCTTVDDCFSRLPANLFS